jgi:hypothetical protein
VKTRRAATRTAKRIILALDAEIQAAGADRNKLKLQIYDYLEKNGLADFAELLMTFDAVVRANMNNPPNVTYNFNNSNIAMANFGTQIGNISASLTAVGSNDQRSKDFSTALKQLTEAVVNSTELNDQQKREALDALSFVGKQAEEPPEKRQTGVLKPVLEAIPKVLSAGSALVTLWHTFGPHILVFFGL